MQHDNERHADALLEILSGVDPQHPQRNFYAELAARAETYICELTSLQRGQFDIQKSLRLMALRLVEIIDADDVLLHINHFSPFGVYTAMLELFPSYIQRREEY